MAVEKEKKEKKAPEASDLSQIIEILKPMAEELSALGKRVKSLETGGKSDFREEVKAEDVEKAKLGREKADPRVTEIVDELLGEDFGIKMEGFKDKPGHLFTLIVPPRLSDNVQDKRPMLDTATGQYKKDELGNVIFEDYTPEDRRSVAVSGEDSYDVIREYCEKVRGYIVSYHQKLRKPLPEFKVK